MPVIQGICYPTFGFEVGYSIDLDACERRLANAARHIVPSRGRFPESFEYRPAPLRISTGTDSEAPGSEILLYDFGAAALRMAVPFEGEYESLVSLSAALQSDAALPRQARSQVAKLVESLGSAVTRPRVAEMAEEYFTFCITSPPPAQGASILINELAPITAQILRPGATPPSRQEMHDAISGYLSFTPDDLTVVDWNAAIVWDPDFEDIRFLLEFANVQLLEMRYLDSELDRTLDHAYTILSRPRRGGTLLRPRSRGLERLSELEADGAVLFERITNALKLVGDHYLSRLYQLVAARLHLTDWDRAISRKLDVINRIYEKLEDRSTAKRLEALEWIVILLFVAEILLSLFRGHG